MYDFDSGNICLDFANTKNWHASQNSIEEIRNYAELVGWGEQAGLISHQTAQRLIDLEQDEAVDAQHAYELGIQLRESIYRIFSRLYAGKPIPGEDFSLLNTLVRQANAHRQLCQKETDCCWEWTPDVDGINIILWPVAHAAAELLTSPMATRVRECEDDRGCGYLFVDETKNHSRRWCSMESCGNRAKARRHYARAQAG